ncbi:TetR/AcrR family transcriptional regulator [Microbulbifer sp. VAAF005]|uniref:TetR/AcrR family transcriptional regulator n=1 Tax=Microbulbifer sp. VAAF005 TaxID=3034230 RepID=UPI0024AD0D2B|nr:TetR/AcrR family transcriptional regulator [Microbulbifer sp. VAAF005]WHI46979.1 TetR/AcrR family transcriptional regulator [Microbulbifer sp. VAAF005]
MTDKPSTRGRGRPKDPERESLVREALMQSAYALLRDKAFRDISIREIALGAGVNSAMISYHFGGKEGLIIEVVRNQIMRYGPASISAELDGMEPSLELLKEAMSRMIRLYIKEPWIPRLIVDEVASKSGRMRELFADRLASQLVPKLRGLLGFLQSSGQLREDLDINLMPISFVSLVAFPFIAGDPLKEGFGFALGEENREKWINHTVQLLLRGVSNKSMTEGEDVGNGN